MSTHTAVTAPTEFVEANSIRFAYRTLGKRSGLPLFQPPLNGIWTIGIRPSLTASLKSAKSYLQ